MAFTSMKSCFSNIERYGYLCHHIQLCMYLDARLCTFESYPFEKGHTEVYSGGIKSIEPSIEYKLLVNTLFMNQLHHMISEFFKNRIIPKLIHLRQLGSVNKVSTKTKMIRLFGVSSSNICEFPKTTSDIQLTKHENQHLIPACQTPITCSVFVPEHKSFEISLRYEFYYLTNNILSLIHVCQILWLKAKITITNDRQDFR